jgi:fluoroquinolone resistance protein
MEKDEIRSGNEQDSKNIFLFEKDFYEETKFEKLNITDSKVVKIEFYNCSFVSCLFTKTIFENCVFEKCTFTNCDLSVVKFSGSAFIDVGFSESKMLGIDWALAQKPISVNFDKCLLNDSIFYRMDLRSSQIKKCVAHNADFEEANLSKSECCQTDFLNSKFNGANLSFSDFAGAINYSINPNNTKIKKAKFSLPEAVSLLDAWDIIIE